MSDAYIGAITAHCPNAALILDRFHIVKTIQRHYDGILAFIDTGLTHAIAVGLNQIVKNRASGFRRLDPFADMIYLTVGDVDIPARIPSKFRTL